MGAALQALEDSLPTLRFVARDYGILVAWERDLPPGAIRVYDVWKGKREEKPKTETKELAEWVDYLNYFREAGGVIPLASNKDEDAVRLITVHGAKGLEFSHVFILRATSPSFPASYRETLVEFPRELRDPDSAAGERDLLGQQVLGQYRSAVRGGDRPVE